MTKFKVGDRVKYVLDCKEIPKNSLATIVLTSGLICKVRWDNPSTSCMKENLLFGDYAFELIKGLNCSVCENDELCCHTSKYITLTEKKDILKFLSENPNKRSKVV